tara:strand:- start:262 stop:456 length:195 start_codon:yes stop_codon:yes gene_type:complete
VDDLPAEILGLEIIPILSEKKNLFSIYRVRNMEYRFLIENEIIEAEKSFYYARTMEEAREKKHP